MRRDKFFLFGICCVLLSGLFTTARGVENTKQNGAIKRYVSQVTEEEAIYYYSQREQEQAKVEKFSANNWKRATPGARSDYLIKFYYATAREVSRSGLKHLVCFLGDGHRIRENFFNEANEMRDLQFVAEDGVTVSDEGLMMGLQFHGKVNQQDDVMLHFRLSHCLNSGKTSILNMEILKNATIWKPSSNRKVASKNQGSEEESEFQKLIKRSPAQVAAKPEDGYKVNIPLTAKESADAKAKGLPQFVLHDPFITSKKVKNKTVRAENAENFPWKNLDLRNPTSETAERFSNELFKYFLEGMFDTSSKGAQSPDLHFNAHNNKERAWCQMPWLNVGDTGREAVHGLTKERDLVPSKIYPETLNGVSGSDWGVGYYNSISCEYIKNIFKSPDYRMKTADWYAGPFPNGSMSLKILFTTAPLNILKKSLMWWSHVSLPGETARALREVRLLQIDIALKDKSVPSEHGSDNWMMSTLYFDPQYDWTKKAWNQDWLKKYPLPKALGPIAHLRPVGIQTGFTPETFTIVEGSITNVANHAGDVRLDGRLLNGPADNPQGSCMGCHGAAGTYSPMVSLVPGVMSAEEYQAIPANKKLDFSMQLGFAKRFYQTSVKK